MQERDALFAAALEREDAGQYDEALRQYGLFLSRHPQHADALHNRGLLLAKLGRLADAEQSHRDYIAAVPGDWRAHADLADVLLALARFDETLIEAQRAIECGSPSFLPYFTAGLAATMKLQFADAQRWIVAAQQLDPAGFGKLVSRMASPGALDRDFDPRAIYLIREFDRFEVCDWRDYERFVDAFRGIVEAGERERWPVSAPPLVFRSLHLPVPQPLRRTLASNAASLFARATETFRAESSRPARTPGRIRIGYLSSDFRTHPTAILGAPVFRLHDRSEFEVHAFSLSPPDDGPWSLEIRRNADYVHELTGLSFPEALARLRGAELDILVDWNGLSTGAFPELIAARPARVQVSYLAFPGSSGGLSDYLVCDRVCVPDGESAGYVEQLARLPRTFWLCDPAATIEPGHVRSRHGLPDDAVVFLAHHPSRKLAPGLFAVWMEILAAAPGSVLWLLEEHPATRDNLLREAARSGIEARRLVFAGRVPHAEHRARIALADIALDTSPCNGGTTTLDALASGVPVVTVPTPGFAGRMAASALVAGGLDDLVQPDLEGYRTLAIRLANERPLLEATRKRVTAARSSPLFDSVSRVRELESAYRAMHERALRGELPASFDVAA